MTGLLRFALVLTLVATACACGKPSEPVVDTFDGLVVRGAGATFPAPLYDRWIHEFQGLSGDIRVTYDSVGSGAGVSRFIDESVDFGASDAAMNDAEIARVERGAHLLPMTGGMVVLAYNVPGLGGQLRLPREVYVDIFLGRIQRWNDPRILAANPRLQLPPRQIQTVVRRDGSGTTFAFTNHLAAISDAWRGGPGVGKLLDWPGSAMTANGNTGVAQTINITRNSIGYVEYGFARRLGLAMAALENATGNYIAPSASSGQIALESGSDLADGDLRLYIPDPPEPRAYPIVTYTWLMVYRRYLDEDKLRALRGFLQWGLGSGQTLAEELGYIPLPESIRRRVVGIVEDMG